jgi:F420-dependent oxidoreductase-like protein
MRIALNVSPSAAGRPPSFDHFVEHVSEIARDGFATAVFAHLTSGFDALTAIAIAGRAVPEIELETAVVPIYTRHPTAMAQQALTTQVAVGGRLTLGIGLSHRPVVETVWGMSFERPVEYMQEYLAILQPLLHGEAVAFAGRRFRAQAQPPMTEVPPPPVLLAALGERMLRLAGEQTDGTVTWMVGARTLAEHVTPVISAAAQAAGRPAPRIVVGLPICVTSDPDAARARAARAFERYGQLPSYRAMLDREGAASPADVALVGSESEVEAQLDELEKAGATDFNGSVFGSAEEHQRTLQFLRTRLRTRLQTRLRTRTQVAHG